MKLKQLINLSKKNLQQNKIKDSNIKIKLLIEHIFNIKKEQIILSYDKKIKKEKILEFNSLLDKLKNGVPIQYIINKQEFMGLHFYVNENVLIPQPDTETLVEEVIKYCNIIRKNNYETSSTNCKENNKKNYCKSKKIKILDLCTGSGIIGISLCKYLGNVETYASDINAKALDIARKNAEDNNVSIQFIHSDMFNNIQEKAFDIIVSNPPYIESGVIKKLSKEVQNEPKLALDGGRDGLRFYKIIAENAKEFLKQEGIIFLEIGYDQKEKVEKIFSNYNYYSNIKCIKDLSGNDRVIIIKK